MVRNDPEWLQVSLPGPIEVLRSTIQDCIPQLFEFSYRQDPDVRSISVSVFCILAKYGQWKFRIFITPLIWAIDGLRSLIHTGIPPMINLLNDADATVRCNSVHTISIFVEFSERQFKGLPLSSLWTIDDLRSLLHASVPLVIKLLDDPYSSVRSSAVNSLCKLSKYGGWYNDYCGSTQFYH